MLIPTTARKCHVNNSLLSSLLCNVKSHATSRHGTTCLNSLCKFHSHHCSKQNQGIRVCCTKQLRYTCRLNDIAAHTAIWSIGLEDFAEIERDVLVNLAQDFFELKPQENLFSEVIAEYEQAVADDKVIEDLMLSNISMLVELLETSATPELDRCIFRKAIKLEINALKNLYLKRTTIHHYSNSTTYRTSEKSLNEKSTICDDGCDDNDAATDSTYYSSVFSSLNSFVSSSLLISSKKMKISDREWFHRCFGWLTRSSRKKEWRRTFQGPVRNGRIMEMVFYDNTQSDSCSF